MRPVLTLLVALTLSYCASLSAELQTIDVGGFGRPPDGPVVKFTPGAGIQEQVQESFILAEPGTLFRFAEGTYTFTMGLSLDVYGCKIEGAGMDKTIFDFKGQDAGSEGLLVTSDNVMLENLALVDAQGNCFKSTGANGLVLHKVRAEWTGGPKESNGAYGFYPVSGEGIYISECYVAGASDAGIYVGQCKKVIVRDNTVKYNVAGIEIENCHGADIFGNTATKNTGGILAFDMPDLPLQRGRDIRIFKNKVFENDTENFAPKGNIVATVPTGTGVMIMSNSNVEIFENELHSNGTANLLITSYLSTGRPMNDPNYYPYPERIQIYNNIFGPSGQAPKGENGELIASLTGTPVPDIVWDGLVNQEKLVEGLLPEELRVIILENTHTNGEVSFANLNLPASVADPAQVKRDMSVHQGEIKPNAPVDYPPKIRIRGSF